MPRFVGELGEGESGTRRRGGTCNGRTPPQADRDLGAGRGRKRRERTRTGAATDAGTRRGAQGRAAEADRWWVWATPRWLSICTGVGGGELVKLE